MVEGQGWEGMYFLDEKLQFLCKNRKNLSTKVEKLGKSSPKEHFDLERWKCSYFQNQLPKGLQEMQIKNLVLIRNVNSFFFFLEHPPCSSPGSSLAPGELSSLWLVCLGAGWQMDTYPEAPLNPPFLVF